MFLIGIQSDDIFYQSILRRNYQVGNHTHEGLHGAKCGGDWHRQANDASQCLIQPLYTPMQPSEFGKDDASLWSDTHRLLCGGVVHRSLPPPLPPSFICFGLLTTVSAGPPSVTHE